MTTATRSASPPTSWTSSAQVGLTRPSGPRKRSWNSQGSADGPWARYVNQPDARGIGTVRYPHCARDAETAEELAKRTLTNLYNQRPQWLALAHDKLDAAVFAAYGWDSGMGDEEILAGLLELNRERGQAKGDA